MIDSRIARALQIRLDRIFEGMRDCEDRRQEAYQIADACLREFDQLAEQRFWLTRALWKVEKRLSAASFDRQDRDEVAA